MPAPPADAGFVLGTGSLGVTSIGRVGVGGVGIASPGLTLIGVGSAPDGIALAIPVESPATDLPSDENQVILFIFFAVIFILSTHNIR